MVYKAINHGQYASIWKNVLTLADFKCSILNWVSLNSDGLIYAVKY